jgi:Flp pilus assembly pilin Flp
MFERMQLALGRLMTLSAEDLKREDGQGATEYAIVIVFLIIGLGVTVGVLGTKIGTFLSGVGDALNDLLP